MSKAKKLIAGVIATMGMGALGVAANGSTASADEVYTVESGDTLSSIAQKELGDSSKYQEIANENGITDVNNISVGQVLHIGDAAQGSAATVVLPATSVQTQTQEQTQTQPVVQKKVETQSVQEQMTYNKPVEQTYTQPSTTQSSNYSSNDNSVKARRRQIESGGNYNTNTGNGYVGAYQFAPSTIASIEQSSGMKWSMDPATQDAFADYYANQRYGGWQNVPTNGGW